MLSLGESSYTEEEARREQETDRHVEELLKEVRIWRVANSAQWVAWGIVQAKVPELDEKSPVVEGAAGTEEPVFIGEPERPGKPDQRPEGPDSMEEAENEEDEFDYLGYAQERARFFWGDVVGLGLVAKEELPEELVRNLKVVEY
jgi:choline kinase